MAIVGLTAGVVASSLDARSEERANRRGQAPDAPLTISGKVKPVNRDVELAVDPNTGDGLAVWNQSKRKQGFGHIWAAELIRQGDGSYQAGKAFRVSVDGRNQRPTVEYLPALGVYMIMWDQGPRDPEALGSANNRILSRIYTPTGAGRGGARVGTLRSTVEMTDNDGANVAPALIYTGPSGRFERLIYEWWDVPTGAGHARTEPPGPHKAFTDVDDADTLRSPETSPPVGGDQGLPFGFATDAMQCPDGTVYWQTGQVDVADGTTSPVQFGLVGTGPGSLTGTFDLLGGPADVDSLDAIHGALLPEGECDRILGINNGGGFRFDPLTGDVETVDIGDDPGLFTGSFFEASGGFPRAGRGTSALIQGYVMHTPAKGQFAARGVDKNSILGDAVTKLWKIKKKRMMGMDIEEAGDTVLVAWAESKNKKGTKSTIKVGWFVPQ